MKCPKCGSESFKGNGRTSKVSVAKTGRAKIVVFNYCFESNINEFKIPFQMETLST